MTPSGLRTVAAIRLSTTWPQQPAGLASRVLRVRLPLPASGPWRVIARPLATLATHGAPPFRQRPPETMLHLKPWPALPPPHLGEPSALHYTYRRRGVPALLGAWPFEHAPLEGRRAASVLPPLETAGAAPPAWQEPLAAEEWAYEAGAQGVGLPEALAGQPSQAGQEEPEGLGPAALSEWLAEAGSEGSKEAAWPGGTPQVPPALSQQGVGLPAIPRLAPWTLPRAAPTMTRLAPWAFHLAGAPAGTSTAAASLAPQRMGLMLPRRRMPTPRHAIGSRPPEAFLPTTRAEATPGEAWREEGLGAAEGDIWGHAEETRPTPIEVRGAFGLSQGAGAPEEGIARDIRRLTRPLATAQPAAGAEAEIAFAPPRIGRGVVGLARRERLPAGVRLAPAPVAQQQPARQAVPLSEAGEPLAAFASLVGAALQVPRTIVPVIAPLSLRTARAAALHASERGVARMVLPPPLRPFTAEAEGSSSIWAARPGSILGLEPEASSAEAVEREALGPMVSSPRAEGSAAGPVTPAPAERGPDWQALQEWPALALTAPTSGPAPLQMLTMRLSPWRAQEARAVQRAAAALAHLPSLGPGEPLSLAVRRPMETLLGRDLSSVRLHTSPVAEELGAQALTTGRHVVFAPGRLEARTPRGLALMGHELRHLGQPLAFKLASEGAAGSEDVEESAARQQEEAIERLITQGWPQAPRLETRRAARALASLVEEGGLVPPVASAAAPAAAPAGEPAAASTEGAASGEGQLPAARLGQAAPANRGAAPGPATPDVEALARQVYGILKSRLRAERDRHVIYER